MPRVMQGQGDGLGVLCSVVLQYRASTSGTGLCHAWRAISLSRALWGQAGGVAMEVKRGADGYHAIQKFRQIQPDVSVLDWNLPTLGGEEVAHHAQRGSTKSMPHCHQRAIGEKPDRERHVPWRAFLSSQGYAEARIAS